MLRKKTMTEGIVFLLVFVFVYTAMDKWLHLEGFRYNLARGPFTPVLAPFAWGLPVIEWGTALLLTFPATRKAGFFASTGLFILFTGYVAGMLLTGVQLPCPCGGLFQSLSWGKHVFLTGLLAILSLLGWRWQSGLESERKKPCCLLPLPE